MRTLSNKSEARQTRNAGNLKNLGPANGFEPLTCDWFVGSLQAFILLLRGETEIRPLGRRTLAEIADVRAHNPPIAKALSEGGSTSLRNAC